MKRSRTIDLLCISALLVGAVLTAYGIYSTKWHMVGGHYWFLCGSAAIFVVAGVFNRSLGLWLPPLAIALLAVVSGTLWPFLVASLFFFSSYLVGSAVLKRIGYQSPIWVESTIAGAGVYGTTVGFAAFLPVSYPGVYALALLMPLLANKAELVRVVSHVQRWAFTSNKIERDRTDIVLIAIMGALAFMYFAVALMPEVGQDALAMHLFIPGQILAKHEWKFDVSTYVWAVIPLLGDWIYTVGYLLAGETAARLINWGFILLNACLVWELAKILGAPARGALWAVVVYLSTPLTLAEASTLFIESVWSAFVLCGILLLARLGDSRNETKQLLPASGFVLGCALSTKAVTLSFAPGILIFLLIRLLARRREAMIASLGKAFTFFLALGASPYLIAWHKTANPVFPFFNKIFKSPYWPAENFDNPWFSAGISWDTPYRVIFSSSKYFEAYPGASGFQWLVLLLPVTLFVALSKKKQAGGLMVVAVIIVAAVFFQTSYLRYVFPALGMFSAVMGLVIAGAEGFFGLLLRTASSVVLLLNAVFLFSGSPGYSSFPILAALSPDKRSEYIERATPVRRAVEIVNPLNRDSSPVPFFSSPFAAGLQADVLYANWYNYKFQDPLMAAKDVADVVDILDGRNVEYIVSDRNWALWQYFPVLKASLPVITDLVAEVGSVEIRRRKNQTNFETEQLKNAAFDSIAGWNMAPGAEYNSATGTVSVSVSKSVNQAVSVGAGRAFLNTVVFRCLPKGADGVVRTQVNWLDAKGGFLSADIQTFGCTKDWKSVSQTVRAPKGASTAIVYGTSHTEQAVEISEISFKR